ncbi:MAG: adenylate/guanylate cyclase domain-containing protein, partial [Verrucomicrobiota bacterium]|nr:adenylate/guanylate cyclase domain-containing protein [Verrucomicrobiota bacterium]
MAADSGKDSRLEIAHVLFIDIVGYSKLLINQQSELLRLLNEIARSTEQFRAAEKADMLVRLPTGDGMALAFFTSPDAPVRCAMEIDLRLKEYPQLNVRMGIHSGPVDSVKDVNDRTNVAGAGINMAQRVMDCGDAGHILLSKRVADDLAQYERWQPHLHDLGACEVKHGVRMEVVNLYTGEVGREDLPEKFKRQEQEHAAIESRAAVIRRRKMLLRSVAIVLLVAAIAGLWVRLSPNLSRESPEEPAPVISEKSIAVLPFENRSAEKDDAFFADGIQDDVLASLSKIKDLKVIARSSVMAYRGEAATGKLREIGRALQVSHVLQGSVRRQADRVLINVQLSDTRDDRHVWS